MQTPDPQLKPFDRLVQIITDLRSPEGCPWDRKQTPQSLRSHLIEEAYECVDALDENDAAHIQEELGDVALLVTMIAAIFEERGTFTIDSVIQTLNDKLIRRHPHVFGDAHVTSPDEVVTQWNEIKTRVEGKPSKDGRLDGVSRALHPLERAYKLQKEAAKHGFDWPTFAGVRDKIREELDEVVEAAGGDRTLAEGRLKNRTYSEILEGEIGDLLFSVVNLARYLDVDPGVALNTTNRKFVDRFATVERTMAERGIEMSASRLAEMDEIWNAAKRGE